MSFSIPPERPQYHDYILSEEHSHHDCRSQVEHDIEEYRLLVTGIVLDYGKMTRTADGQPFRYALDYTH